MADKLPDELWLEIAHAPNGHSWELQTLNSLSRCSSRLSRIIRPILYRHVVLSDKDRPYASSYARHPLPAAIKLLRADTSLASAVRRLDYMSGSQSSCDKAPYLVDPQMIKNLTRLECISFYGGVFMGISTVMQKRVLAAIGGLQHLKMLAVADIQFPLGLTNTGVNWAQRLESVHLLGSASSSHLWTTIATGSLSTITTLNLGFDSVSYSSPQGPTYASRYLLSLHFPRLRSLSLGIWSLHWHQSDFADFLLLHSPTLEDLGLEYHPTHLMASEFHDSYSPDSLTLAVATFAVNREEMLKGLKSFRGHTSCLEVMVRARLKCLETTLETLSIGTGGIIDGPTSASWGFYELLAALEESTVDSPLARVRRVFIDMTTWSRCLELVHAILPRFGPFLPSLEEWCGGLPVLNEKTKQDTLHYDSIFSAFPQIRTLCIPGIDVTCRGDACATQDGGVHGVCTSMVNLSMKITTSLVTTLPNLERLYAHDTILRITAGWEICREEESGRSCSRSDPATIIEKSVVKTTLSLLDADQLPEAVVVHPVDMHKVWETSELVGVDEGFDDEGWILQ